MPKRVLLVSVIYRMPRNMTLLFGNPAILLFRTRGFASPDYSGFARSENVGSLFPPVLLFSTQTHKKRSAIIFRR